MPPVSQGRGASPNDSPSRSAAGSSSSILVQSAWEEGQSAFLQPALQPEVLTAAQQVPAAAVSAVTADTSVKVGPQKVQHVQSAQLEAPSEAVNDSMLGLNAAELRLFGIDKQQEVAEQLLAQLPAQLSTQMPAQIPAHLPETLAHTEAAQVPAQLMGNLLNMDAQHTNSSSSLPPSTVAAQQATGDAVGSMPPVSSALQAADSNSSANQLAAAGERAAAAEVLPGSVIGLNTQAIAQPPAQPPAQMPARMSAQAPEQTPAQMPAQAPAQVPAQVPAQMPAQMPAQTPAQTLAQTPAQTPAQMPTQMPAQLPAHLPAHLPETLDHTEAHHLKSNTTLPSSDITPQSLQQANVEMVGAVPANTSAWQAADSKGFDSQLAATAGTDAEEVTAAVEPLHTSNSGFHTQSLADCAAGCSSRPTESSAGASIHAQIKASAQAAAESAPVLDAVSVASEPGSVIEAVAEAPKEDEVDTVVRGISGVWRDVNRSTAFGPESEAEVVTEAMIEADIEPFSSGASGVWRDVDSPVSSLGSEELLVADKDNSSEDLEGFESDRSLFGDASPCPSVHAAMSSSGSDGKHGDRQPSPPSDLQALNMPSETLVDDTLRGTIHFQGQQGVHVGLLEGAPTQKIAPAASPAPSQGPSQDALMQQGMAAASARLLVMGSLWGSNLGSLCNLGLILSPSGFILLTPKYEILEIIGEGAYGEALFTSRNRISNGQ